LIKVSPEVVRKSVVIEELLCLSKGVLRVSVIADVFELVERIGNWADLM